MKLANGDHIFVAKFSLSLDPTLSGNRIKKRSNTLVLVNIVQARKFYTQNQGCAYGLFLTGLGYNF